jgi:hypothetical protein
MFRKVDRKAPEILRALEQAPVYRKKGMVKARPAVEGELVKTRLSDGTEETSNTAKANDWVMTNPSGEQYIISQEKFFSRYEVTDVEGVYAAKGYCVAIKNPFGEPIEIMASWGSPQTGDENCMIADTCDANGKNRGGEPYLIDGKAFAETYA